jgi:UDP-2-acetamido-2,6-beta-L-arabino-hexul-4-ose reductase
VTISDPARTLDLVYVQDVVDAFIGLLKNPGQKGTRRLSVPPVTKVSLVDLAQELYKMHEIRDKLVLPDLTDRFRKCLYSTYLSFLPQDGFGYQLSIREDPRGSLAEFLRSSHFGQIFVSRTKPGVVRGNHYHDSKAEKFFVVEGEAIIRFRHVSSGEILEYPVVGKDFRVVDIPPGYTHSIQNVGVSDLVVIFWSSELFDPNAPDTYPLSVIQQ